MSFQQGLSGLSAASKNLEVIGNNISNANTIGSKSSRAEFSDMYSSAAGGGGSVGIGTRVSAVTQDHTQGSITTTGNNLDLAVNGGGYFQVADMGSAVTGGDVPVMYSRNGQFKSDRLGNIITNDGLRLLGYPATAGVITASGKPVPLTVPDAVLAPNPTTQIGLEINLDAAAVAPDPTVPFSDVDKTTYNYSSTLKVFDNAGQSVEVEYYFRKKATTPNAWEVYITTPNPADPSLNVRVATTPAAPVLQFSADGSTLLSGSPIVIDNTTFSTQLNTLSAGSGVTYAFGGIVTDERPTPQIDLSFSPNDSTGLKGATQRAGNFANTNQAADGYARGTLTGFAFNKEGILTAEYSNGKSVQTAQVVLTNFRNPQGLISIGGNVWSEGPDAGAKYTGVPGSGNLGEISAGALEESNVDLTAALVSLITAQRTYQANAQTIKTQDQVLQTFVNMR